MTEAEAIEAMARVLFDKYWYDYSPFLSCCHSAEEHREHTMQQRRDDASLALRALLEGQYVLLRDQLPDETAERVIDDAFVKWMASPTGEGNPQLPEAILTALTEAGFRLLPAETQETP